VRRPQVKAIFLFNANERGKNPVEKGQVSGWEKRKGWGDDTSQRGRPRDLYLRIWWLQNLGKEGAVVSIPVHGGVPVNGTWELD